MGRFWGRKRTSLAEVSVIFKLLEEREGTTKSSPNGGMGLTLFGVSKGVSQRDTATKITVTNRMPHTVGCLKGRLGSRKSGSITTHFLRRI